MYPHPGVGPRLQALFGAMPTLPTEDSLADVACGHGKVTKPSHEHGSKGKVSKSLKVIEAGIEPKGTVGGRLLHRQAPFRTSVKVMAKLTLSIPCRSFWLMLRKSTQRKKSQAQRLSKILRILAVTALVKRTLS